MKIKDVETKNNFFLAPMAGFTECVFRSICAEAGAGMVETEMVSAKGLVYKNENTVDLLRHGKEATTVQLFGSEPDILAQAVTFKELSSFALIDLNMGCPVPKVASVGAGCVLMKDLKLASSLISAVKLHTSKPVSVKCRLGWDRQSINVLDFAKMCEDSGADILCVHGRTREQMYSGHTNWDMIARVKQTISIPVVGNGDITTQEQAKQAIAKYGVDGVMIGRGALGNPWIFSALSNTQFNYSKKDIILSHYSRVKDIWGERFTVPFMRKHLVYYLKNAGIPRKIRAEMVLISEYDELISKLNELLKNL
ncbi:MAG: tRNA dihydrouridine synthase DusB [Clostridia bacterium]|nr:tRNA dihydrouridine synthase DusB [Clostridia bacterium]